MCLPIAPLHGRSPCESECPLRPCLTPAVKTCSKQHAIVAWLCSPTEFFSFGPPAAARGTAMQRLIQRSATAGTLLVWTVTAALHGGRSGWGPQGMHFNVGQWGWCGGGREAARAGQMVGVPPGSTTTVMCSKLEAVPSARSLRSAALAAWVAITGVFAVVTENVIFAACKIAATSVSG
ncbi:unnamed protein product, partial [Prorocentrum cordatum]